MENSKTSWTSLKGLQVIATFCIAGSILIHATKIGSKENQPNQNNLISKDSDNLIDKCNFPDKLNVEINSIPNLTFGIGESLDINAGEIAIRQSPNGLWRVKFPR